MTNKVKIMTFAVAFPNGDGILTHMRQKFDTVSAIVNTSEGCTPNPLSQVDRVFSIGGIEDRSTGEGGSDDMGMSDRRYDMVIEMNRR
ncbi:MAG: hypothetical protein JZU65_16220 [Chlorobium sp.]|nr:hypothetical protein [Chlorobium sp.]